MRVSTSQIFRQGVDSIQSQQAAASKTSLQMASGKRILVPSDDPAGAVQVLELRSAIETTQQYQKNALLAEARLNREESLLEGAGTNLLRVRELAVQGNNDTLSAQDRGFIAAELRQRLDELLTLANSRDANGEYIFAGTRSHTEPFAPAGAGGFSYSGDDRQRLLQISASRRVGISDSGQDVFMAIPNGNGAFVAQDDPVNTGTGIIDPGSVNDPSAYVPDTYTISFTAPDAYEVRDSGGTLVAGGVYTPGASIGFNGIQTHIKGEPQTGDVFTIAPSASQDVFSTYQNLIDALENPGGTAADKARFHNAMNRALTDLDQAQERFLDIRAGVGGRLNTLDTQREINEGAVVSLETTLSEIQDLDYAEAISRLKSQLAGLQAAQQTYIQFQRLSLFDYLR
jgi:flagellar hook-associated protein 3 FlgL